MKTRLFAAITALALFAAFTSCGADKEEANGDEIVENVDELVEEISPESQNLPTIPSWMPDSVQITPSGLGVVIENPGDSTRANNNSQVTLNYRGTLTNGTEFDSSYKRGEPATFSPSAVIPGFGEGIKMLGKGGKATLYIPGNIAYGPQSIPQIGIGPFENLIFDIEIIDIQ